MTPVPSIGSTSLRRGDGRGVGGAVCRWGIDAEEATAVVRPGAKAKLITGSRFAELLAPGQFGSEGASIISRGHPGHRRPHGIGRAVGEARVGHAALRSECYESLT